MARKKGTSLSVVAQAPQACNLISPDGSCNQQSDEFQMLLSSLSKDHKTYISSARSAILAGVSAGRCLKALRVLAQRNWEQTYEERIKPILGVSLRQAERYMKMTDQWDAATSIAQSTGDSNAITDSSLVGRIQLYQELKRNEAPTNNPNDWCTPDAVIASALKTIGKISTDPCALVHDSSKPIAETNYVYVSDEQNGLSPDVGWEGACWIAPGHSGELAPWVDKSIVELQSGRMTEGLILLPLQHALAHRDLRSFPFVVLKDRLAVKALRQKVYKDKVTKEKVIQTVLKDVVLTCEMIVTYISRQPDIDRFVGVFGDMGVVFVPVNTPAKKSFSLIVDSPCVASSAE
ncbi:MAG: hypothetical protein U0930_12335 [Pirellulales bacterium]